MAVKVKKGNEVMAVRNEHQLAAFLNNGWELATSSTTEASKAAKAKAEETADAEKEPEAPRKPATRRKATTRKAR